MQPSGIFNDRDDSPVEVIKPIVLNRQTGLFEQTIRVMNVGVKPIKGIRVLAESLASGVRLFNAAGAADGLPYVESDLTLVPSTSIDFHLEYYAPSREPFESPILHSEFIAAETVFRPAGRIERIERQMFLPKHEFMIEFGSLPAQEYYVQYSEDFLVWSTALPVVKGTGSKIQWIDSGAPKTRGEPQKIRFYRVVRSP